MTIVGLSVAVRPADWLVDSDTVPLNPLIGVIVNVNVAGTPASTVRYVGLTETEKSTILTVTVTE